MSETTEKMPFGVQWHNRMTCQSRGKDGSTVLTIEGMIFNHVIREYCEPWSWERQWCFDSEIEAVDALLVYLIDPAATEPVGWKRSIVAGQPTRYAPQTEKEETSEQARS